MLQKFYYFIFPFLSPLFSFFLFSSLSLSGSLSLLPILVPSLFDQSEMFTISDDGVALTTTTRSATLDLAPTTRSHSSHSISPMLQPLDLTHAQPLLISPISPRGHRRSHAPATLPLSGCGLFYFIYLFFRCNLGWSDGGGGLWGWWPSPLCLNRWLFVCLNWCWIGGGLAFGWWLCLVIGICLFFFFFFSFFPCFVGGFCLAGCLMVGWWWWLLPCWACVVMKW